MIRRLSRLISPVLDVVLPPQCWVTGEPIASGDYGLSGKARLAIGKLAGQHYCLHCGLSIGPYEVHDKRDPCGRCGDRDLGLERMARAGSYSEPLSGLVLKLKFGEGGGRGSWEIAPVLAPFILQAIGMVSQATDTPVDALVPVPLHWRRQARRGFNQAEELARHVGGLGRWRVFHALVRKRATQEQTALDSAAKRRENLRGAFAARAMARRGKLAGKHVWLIDDVSTTGATLRAAAVALRKLPAKLRPASISAAVVCVTDHGPPPVDAGL